MDDSDDAGKDGQGAETDSARYGQVLQGVSALIAPATLLTGIAFFFGWSRVQAFDSYFGLNAGAVGYSTRDYVLNSLNALFLPVIVVLVVLMALAFAHAYIGRVHNSGEKPETLRRFSEVCLIGGVILVVVGGLGAFGVLPFHTPYLIATLFPAGGVLLIAHAVDLRARLRGDPPLSTGGRVLIGLFVAVCLFWAAGLYAGTVGRDEAATLARHLDELPGVTISSATDLALPSLARHATSGGAGAGFHTYRGLRLLTWANGTMFLLPNRWRAGRGTLFAVPETAATRLSFTPGKLPSLSSLVASGFTGNTVPVTSTRPSQERFRQRKLGPLVVQLAEPEGEPATVTLVNKTSHPISGVSVSGRLARRAQPLVVGGAALCRVARVRFACGVDTIPPHRRRLLRISFRGPRAARGRLTVEVGGARRMLPLQLSR